MYYIYIVRCEDNSLYTGITTDIKRRLTEHKEKKKPCAKYTMSHTILSLEALWTTDNKASASRLEYRIKTLSKAKKEQLIWDKNLLYSMLSLGDDKYDAIEDLSAYNLQIAKD